MRPTELEIGPGNKVRAGFRELWEFRELFYYFTWRDIKVKYKQTVLGLAWAVLQPLLLMFLFTFFLGRAISKDTDLDLPYDVFALSGLVLWGIFSQGINNAGNSMVSNAAIIRKVYFPRLIIPFSAVLVALFDFVAALILFLVYCLIQGQPIHVSFIFYAPLAILLTTVSASGMGCLLAALNVKYRDFRYVIPFLVQVFLFASPVIYPTSIVNHPWMKTLLGLNPMTTAMQLFRAGLHGSSQPIEIALPGIVSAIVLFLLGLFYFKKTEQYFADLA